MLVGMPTRVLDDLFHELGAGVHIYFQYKSFVPLLISDFPIYSFTYLLIHLFIYFSYQRLIEVHLSCTAVSGL